MSNHGVIQQVSDGSYQLILDHGDVEKVLAFSNRPYRLVIHEIGEALKTMWSEVTNSFADDPPNVTVIINQQLQTIIFTSMRLNGDQTIFTIESDGQNSLAPMSGACQVFVDGDGYYQLKDGNWACSQVGGHNFLGHNFLPFILTVLTRKFFFLKSDFVRALKLNLSTSCQRQGKDLKN